VTTQSGNPLTSSDRALGDVTDMSDMIEHAGDVAPARKGNDSRPSTIEPTVKPIGWSAESNNASHVRDSDRRVVCACSAAHPLRRVVLTGGPGAGKTAVLEMLAHLICSHVTATQESAGILFSGGFPRRPDVVARRAVQRAIFFVQLELEALAAADQPALIICDRGIVDGAAYWPGPDAYWDAVGMPRATALARYDAVIHLRTPGGTNGYGHQNPVRIESPLEAHEIDERIIAAWNGHPRRFVVEATSDFVSKAARAIALVLKEVPSCCRVLPDTSVLPGNSVSAAPR
jgi:predicted ATPase